VGQRQMMPIGTKEGDSLERLDDVDFQKDMIVAAFWGLHNFSGHNEKCWIESVEAGKDQVTVDCRSNLWGGAVLRSYRAWPYEARVVPRSALPVKFTLKTVYEPKDSHPEQNLELATLKPDEWKQPAK
jgi:hypothetical protein